MSTRNTTVYLPDDTADKLSALNRYLFLRTIMKSFFILALLISLFSSNFFPCHADEVIDRVVAQVNDDVITLSELNDKGKPLFQAIMAKSQKNSLENELQKARIEVLDKLIEELLINQEAARYGIDITSHDLDEAIDSIIKQNNITKAQFNKELKRLGTTENGYRESIQNQMLRSRIINVAIRAKILITAEQVKEYYDTYYTPKEGIPEGYHILQIGLQWGDGKKLSSQDEAVSLAKKIIQELAAGQDFSSLARSYSQLPSAADGGDIGAFKEEEMAPYMLQAVAAMHPGESSGIIQTPVGLQILKLLSLKKDGITEQPPIESVQNDIEDIIYKREMKKEYDKWLNSLHAKAYVKRNL